MRIKQKLRIVLLALLSTLPMVGSQAWAQSSKPNIVFIMGDDIGWMQPSITTKG
jgi:hypothetical protein